MLGCIKTTVVVGQRKLVLAGTDGPDRPGWDLVDAGDRDEVGHPATLASRGGDQALQRRGVELAAVEQECWVRLLHGSTVFSTAKASPLV